MKFFRKKNGQAQIEIAILLVFILTVFFVFSKYMVRGFTGRWKATGDVFGYGKQYDPDKTVECQYYASPETPPVHTYWFRADLYEQNCRERCLSGSANIDDCRRCMREQSRNPLSRVCNDRGAPPPA